MSDNEGKCGGKKCPYGFGGRSGSGRGVCPYGFGGRSHGHYPSSGHGKLGHCPYLQGHYGHDDQFVSGSGCPLGFGQHGSGHHGFGHLGSGHGHHGSDLPQCPWMVARMHACPWAWGVGSGNHAHRPTGGRPCCSKAGKSCGDFCVTLKVDDFCSEELEVKVVGQEVVVHGKHELRPDPADSSTVAREFTRRYALPDGIDPETVASSLTGDHELIVTAAKKVAEGEARVVPIQVGEGSGDH